MSAALIVATLATIAAMAFLFSWLHSGGDPHGMGAPPGPWKILGRVTEWLLLGTILLGALGEDRGRLFILGSVPAVAFVVLTVIRLDFD